MKNNVLFKFIALALCALSLLGIVGSGLGIYAMAGGGLYDQSVEAMVQTQVHGEGQYIARNTASRYASLQLGGMPERIAWDHFPNYAGVLSHYGYQILDDQGNVLESSIPDGYTDALVYSYEIEGNYLHLVDTMTEEEKYPPAQTEPVSIQNGEHYSIYDAIPPEGAQVSSVDYATGDGQEGGYATATDRPLGFVFYNSDGAVSCRFSLEGITFPLGTSITEIELIGMDGELLYLANAVSGIGWFSMPEPGTYDFDSVSAVAIDALNETVPITEPTATVETIPAETVAETVPETTAATEPPVTEPETDLHIVDDLPESGTVEVTRIKVVLMDGKAINHEDEGGIGRVRHSSSGGVKFLSYEPLDLISGAPEVKHIRFMNKKGAILFDASCSDGVGKLYYDDDGCLNYVSDYPIPEETEPEETEPETVPETIPETIPETVPETVPPIVETVPVATEAALEPTEPVIINGKPLEEYDINTDGYWDNESQQHIYVDYVYVPLPKYTVEIHVTEASLSYREGYQILQLVQDYHNYLLPALGISILAFAMTLVYLCTAAGRKPKTDEVRAGGLNRIPLDLYLCGVCIGIPFLVIATVEGGQYLMRQDMLMGCAVAVLCAYAAAVLAVGFLFAMVAQCKTPDGFWWRNTLCGLCIRLFMRFAVWLEQFMAKKCFPWLGRVIKKLWKLLCAAVIWFYYAFEKGATWVWNALGSIFRKIGNWIHQFLRMLPVTWQWLLVGIFFILLMLLVIGTNGEEVLVAFWIIAFISVLVYASHCFGNLWDATKKMGQGDLDTKVDEKLMLGSFKDFAHDLNSLADVAVVAAQKQLKSERMKTELITNVSHDIKTPLTSIINYVDLLQKPHTEEEERQYLEVLDRQSQRLKKLIEDLMEMSKANTGNMTVEITKVDAVESVNQALGEFADKLDRARLIPVFRHSEASVPMMADGRLVWRVLSNLLTNAVKYAMPGTRVYIDLMTLEGKVVISLKNISREELRADPEELMERFVRGDDSRNTEGSGLGLNIAKSLMELQKGQLQLLVDGDLFKVTLVFPGE